MYKYYYLFDIVCLILIYFTCFLPRWKKDKKSLFLKSILYIYISFVLYFTLIPFIIPIPYINFNISSVNLNLVPFNDILHGYGGSIRELVLNIVMMLPFGIMIPFIYKKNFFSTVKYTLGFSLIIEFLQIFSYGGLRSFDTTDLISNTIGGIVGYWLYLLFYPLATFVINKIFKDYEKKDDRPPRLTKREKILIGIIITQLLVRSVLVTYI
ncbi:VanZ family protein [Anaerocolumna aminovalerica]|jgi:glycopeptide antibiotics resistance protein|uniref:VanZ family protein n=1 Tax=Anaerocolumna aminovalerica TaxID=1527 RepID=UPI00248AA1AD|nr:VanZ family protein [Anaerocolumna aminovalerica]